VTDFFSLETGSTGVRAALASGALALTVLAASALAAASKPPCEPWEEHSNTHGDRFDGEHFDFHGNHCQAPV